MGDASGSAEARTEIPSSAPFRIAPTTKEGGSVPRPSPVTRPVSGCRCRRPNRNLSGSWVSSSPSGGAAGRPRPWASIPRLKVADLPFFSTVVKFLASREDSGPAGNFNLSEEEEGEGVGFTQSRRRDRVKL